MRSAIFSDRQVFPHEPVLRALARRSSDIDMVAHTTIVARFI